MPNCGHDQIILKLQKRVEKLEVALEKVTKQSAEWQATIMDQLKLITRLQATITDQQRRLSFYENSNSPPSQDSLEWRQEKKERKQEEAGQ